MTRKIVFELPKRERKKLSLTNVAMALNQAPLSLKEIKKYVKVQGFKIPVTIKILDKSDEIEFTGSYIFTAETSGNLLVLVREKLFSPEMSQFPKVEKEKFLQALQEDLASPIRGNSGEIKDFLEERSSQKEKRYGKTLSGRGETTADSLTVKKISEEELVTDVEMSDSGNQLINNNLLITKRKNSGVYLALLTLIELLFLGVICFVLKLVLKQQILPVYLVGICTGLMVFLGLMSISIYIKECRNARKFHKELRELLVKNEVEESEIENDLLAVLENEYLELSNAEEFDLDKESSFKKIINYDPLNSGVVDQKNREGENNLSISKADITKRELTKHLNQSMGKIASNIQSRIDKKQAAFYELCQNISSVEDIKRSQVLIDEIYQLEINLETLQNGELISD